MPTVHPLPVNPTTGQQPLAALRGFGGSGSGHHHHHHHASPSGGSGGGGGGGGVNREVLKQLQDVAWSDEEDDPDCMVCAEPLDLSDQNFKPCQCGLQICQFCYNKLLRDDPRCPGCRRTYDASSVVFQPVDFDEVRRVKEKKARRAKVCKQLDSMGRRHFLDTRIVMKNSVYVVGMKIPGSGSTEEAVSILRSNDYFGQYGKIARIFLRDRAAINSVTPGPAPDSAATATGIYIVYVRREDAARAISSLDGIPAPQGPPGQVLHASYGTTRYCDAFLRGVKCDNPSCQNLHEWGGEGDTFLRNDLETALTRPQEYDARQMQQQLQPPPITQKSAWPKPSADDVDSSALPRTANWGMRPLARPGSASSARASAGAVGSQRPTKIQSTLIPLGGRSSSAFPPPQASSPITLTTKADKEKKRAQAMARGRSDVSTATSSTHTSPKKKPLTVDITSSSSEALASPKVSKNAAATAPVPIPSTSTPTVTTTVTTTTIATTTTTIATTTTNTTTTSTTASPHPPSPSTITPPPHLPVPDSATTSPVKTSPALEVAPTPAKAAGAAAPVPEAKPPAPPEAGPSTYATKPKPPKKQLSTEYPIHSPYPDFDDVFMEPDAAKMGFSFSLALDDDELQRMLELSQAAGGFEPNPYDPLFEELPKLGIPIASLMAAHHPRESVGGPYSGPFSPFAPSSPVESGSLPTTSTEDASLLASSVSEADLGPRTTSRFEFARRGSMASAGTGRGQSPFPGRDEWGRAPSANGYGSTDGGDMRAAIAAAKAAHHGYHPALVHLNSHVAAAAAAAGAGGASASGSGAGGSDSWSNGGDYAPMQAQGYRGFPAQQPRTFGSSYGYGSPQGEPLGSAQSQGQGQSGGVGAGAGTGAQPAPGGHFGGAGAPGANGPPGHVSVPPGYGDAFGHGGGPAHPSHAHSLAHALGPGPGPASPQVYGQMGYVQQRRY